MLYFEAEKEECWNRDEADNPKHKPGSELTDNVVVMRFGMNDNARRLVEVIMIEQRHQQDYD